MQYIRFPSPLEGFTNTLPTTAATTDGGLMYLIDENLERFEEIGETDCMLWFANQQVLICKASYAFM